jgi:transposase-like protein
VDVGRFHGGEAWPSGERWPRQSCDSRDIRDRAYQRIINRRLTLHMFSPDDRHMAETKPQSPAMEFLVDALKRNPKAAYGDLKAKADEKKLKVFPIMYGRAQAMLGIVKMAKRGQGKAAKARSAKSSAAPVRTGPRRGGRRADPSSKSGRVRELLSTGMSAADIAKKVGCTTALVYNIKSAMGRGGGGGGGGGRRGPGRPRASASGVTNMAGLEGILDAVKSADRERAQLRAVLEKIQAVVADALG